MSTYIDPKGTGIYLTDTAPAGPPAWSMTPGGEARGALIDWTLLANVSSIDDNEDVGNEDVGTLEDGDHAKPRPTIKTTTVTVNLQYAPAAGDAGYLLARAAKRGGTVLYVLITKLVSGQLEKFSTGIVTNITRSQNRGSAAVTGQITLALDQEFAEVVMP